MAEIFPAPSSPDDEPSLNWQAQLEYLRGLAQVAQESGLTELQVEGDGVRWTLSRAATVHAAGPEAAVHAAGAHVRPAGPAKVAAEPTTAVVSPMVGVFYRAPSPNDPPFVEVGDRVEVGQTVGLVEAMKVFNEILAEAEGIVAEIVAQTGQLVETGAPLVRLKSS